MVDEISDGERACGFTWHCEIEGLPGNPKASATACLPIECIVRSPMEINKANYYVAMHAEDLRVMACKIGCSGSELL